MDRPRPRSFVRSPVPATAPIVAPVRPLSRARPKSNGVASIDDTHPRARHSRELPPPSSSVVALSSTRARTKGREGGVTYVTPFSWTYVNTVYVMGSENIFGCWCSTAARRGFGRDLPRRSTGRDRRPSPMSKRRVQVTRVDRPAAWPTARSSSSARSGCEGG